MYILNITFVVESGVNGRWLDFVKRDYVPFLAEKGLEPKLSRVLSVDSVSHLTYSMLFDVESIELYKRITGEFFDRYLELAEPLFGAQVVWFTSLMKRI